MMRKKKLLAMFAFAVMTALMLSAVPSVAFATLIGDKLNVEVDDDTYTYQVISAVVNGQGKGTLRLYSFTDGGDPTTDVNDIRESIFIPGEGQYAVVAIGPNVFSGVDCAGDQYLQSITIPNSIESIAEYAFDNCTNLTSVNFGNDSNLKEICGYAFHNCGTAAATPGTITFPTSLQDIKQDAFSGSAFAGPLTIPDAVTHIGADAFADCPNFTSLSIGSGLTSLSNGAFRGCTGLSGNQVIPDTVTAINDKVFYGCTNITGATLSSNLVTLGSEAFGGCTSLAITNIPAGITTFGKSTFAGCTSLSDLTLTDGLAKIGVLAFNGCTGLTSVTIPNSVTLIDTRAFDGCANLETANLGTGLKTIGTGAFQECGKLKAANIPDSVTSLGTHAFNKCYALATLNIGSGVKSIGSTAFQHCTSLASVEIPNSVTSVGDWAFYNCTGLANLTLPNSVKSIGKLAFYNCTSLASLTLPTSLTTIGESAFRQCSGVSSAITIPGSVTSFGKYAFQDCTMLLAVTFGNGLKSISNAAFYNCTSLSSLTIPEGITSVGGQAFDGCTGLAGKTLTLPSTLASAYNQSFGNRYFTTIVNKSDKAFDHYSFLKPDEGSDFYVDASGAKVTSLGKGTYTLSGSAKTSIADATVTGVSNKTYNGKEQTQSPTVKLGDATLIAGTDYTLSYSNNVNAGTATMTVTGKGGYTGTKTATFAIGKAASSIKLAAQSKTYTGKVLAYTGKVTKTGSNGKVTYAYYSDAKCKKAVKAANVKNVGVYYVKATVAANGNYNAATSAAAKLTVNPKGTALKSVKSSAGGFTAKWGKQAAQTTGYQLMYATNAKFTKGKKTVAIAKTGTVSRKVTGLKANTKVYVKVRTYKKVGKATYYSAWSKVKTVITPKKGTALAASKK